MSLTQRFSPATSNHGRRLLQLIGGDGLAFLLFAFFGRMSHGGVRSMADVFGLIEIAAPFALAWYAVAPFAGLYRADVVHQVKPTLMRTPAAWLAALPIGILGRMLLRREDVPALAFWLITFATVLLILLLWRGVYAKLTSQQGEAA